MEERTKMKVLNKYENRKTGMIIEKWETKEQYESQSFKFEQEWKQVG